jgi:hypothetical protein
MRSFEKKKHKKTKQKGLSIQKDQKRDISRTQLLKRRMKVLPIVVLTIMVAFVFVGGGVQ